MLDARRVNILLVDDRPDGLLALEVTIRRPNYHFIKAGSGEEALRFLMDLGEDLAVMLLDVQMPRMDGFETAALIKTQQKYRHVPIIFVTGIQGDPQLINQGYDLGAIDYVTKPYPPNILRSKVAVLVDLYLKTKEIQRLQAEEHRRKLAEAEHKLEQRFLAREQMLVALVENSSEFVALISPPGKIIFLNGAGRRLIEIHKDCDLDEKFFNDYLTADDQQRLKNQIFPQVMQGEQWEGDLKIFPKMDSAAIEVRSRAFPVFDPSHPGTPVVALVCRDITRQKQADLALKESEQRFRTLTSSAPVGIFFTDPAGKLIFVNPRWRELFDVDPDEINQRGLIQLIHPDDRQDLEREWLQSATAKSEFSRHVKLLGRGGNNRWIHLTAVALYDEQQAVQGYIGTCVDVTERLESEKDLKFVAAQLAQSNTELQRFAWVASHDLKEPLRMVSSYLSLLERKYKGNLDSDADQYIHYAVEGANRMYSLVEGLLTFSGIANSGLQLELVDCNLVVEMVLRNLEFSIKEAEAEVQSELLPFVVADASQLGQLFQNLIANAIKYRSQQKPVVKISARLERDDWIFTVVDNGIGIDPKFSEKIFAVFQRLHTKEQYPGAGVGLAICKKIVEGHRGRIWMDPNPEGGSQFRFSLPKRTQFKELTEVPKNNVKQISKTGHNWPEIKNEVTS